MNQEDLPKQPSYQTYSSIVTERVEAPQIVRREADENLENSQLMEREGSKESLPQSVTATMRTTMTRATATQRYDGIIKEANLDVGRRAQRSDLGVRQSNEPIQIYDGSREEKPMHFNDISQIESQGESYLSNIQREQDNSYLESIQPHKNGEHQIYRHDSADPTTEIINSAPEMYVNSIVAPSEESDRNPVFNDYRDVNEMYPSDEYNDSKSRPSEIQYQHQVSAGFGKNQEPQKNQAAIQYVDSIEGSQTSYPYSNNYTNTASVNCNEQVGSMVMSSQIYEDSTPTHGTKAQQLYNELESLQREEQALDQIQQVTRQEEPFANVPRNEDPYNEGGYFNQEESESCHQSPDQQYIQENEQYQNINDTKGTLLMQESFGPFHQQMHASLRMPSPTVCMSPEQENTPQLMSLDNAAKDSWKSSKVDSLQTSQMGMGGGLTNTSLMNQRLNRSFGILMKKPPQHPSVKEIVRQREPSPPEQYMDIRTRSKSVTNNVNRKYCINKLFKKATGVELDNYRKSQEYRTSMYEQTGSQSTHLRNSVSSPPGLVQTQSLRVKSRSKSQEREESIKRMRIEMNRDSLNQESILSSGHKQSTDQKQSKLQRYRQIEKDLAQQRYIEEEIEWRTAQKVRELEELKKRLHEEEMQSTNQEKRVREKAVNEERRRLQMIEEERQKQFVAETMAKMRQFEDQHPEIEFTSGLTRLHEEVGMRTPATPEETQEMKPSRNTDKIEYRALRNKSPHSDVEYDGPRRNTANEILKQRQQLLQRTGGYPPLGGEPRRNRNENNQTEVSDLTNEPPVLSNQPSLKKFEVQHPLREPDVQQHYVSIMSIGEQNRHMPSGQDEDFYVSLKHQGNGRNNQSSHNNSNFTLGQMPSVDSHRQFEAPPAQYDASTSQTMRPSQGPYNDRDPISPYDQQPNDYKPTVRNSTTAHQLQSVHQEYDQKKEYFSPIHPESNGQDSFAVNPNESLLGMNRSREYFIPQKIHDSTQRTKDQGQVTHLNKTRSRSSLRRKDKMYIHENDTLNVESSRNERTRYQYREDAPSAAVPPERSRSRPDVVPSRGPAVSNYKESGSRCGSPIDTMELKSQFGQRQQTSGNRGEQYSQNKHEDTRKLRENYDQIQNKHPLRMRSLEQSAHQNNVAVYHMQHDVPPQLPEEPHLSQLTTNIRRSSLTKVTLKEKSKERSKSNRQQRNEEFQKKLKSTQQEVQQCLVKLNKSISSSNMQNEKNRRSKSRRSNGRSKEHHIIQLDKDQYQKDKRGKVDDGMTQSQTTISESNDASNPSAQGNDTFIQIKNCKYKNNARERSRSKKSMNMRQLLVNDESMLVDNSKLQDLDCTQSLSTVQPNHSLSHRGSLPNIKDEQYKTKESKESRKKSKKALKQKDIQKLMALQVKQAQMLMDLLQQKSVLESNQSVADSEIHNTQQSVDFHQSVRSVKSTYKSISHQKTLDLIQAVYKQMENINQQMARKDKIEKERYEEMEKKMKKLQRKYNKVSQSNIEESSQRRLRSIESNPHILNESKHLKGIQTQVDTERQQDQQHFRSLGMNGLQRHVQHAQSHGNSLGATQRSLASHELQKLQQPTEDIVVLEQNQQTEKQIEVLSQSQDNNLTLKKELDQFEGRYSNEYTNFNQQFPSIQQSNQSLLPSRIPTGRSQHGIEAQNTNFGAQFPSRQSARQQVLQSRNDENKGVQPYTAEEQEQLNYEDGFSPAIIHRSMPEEGSGILQKMERKLRTIQSVVNEDESFGKSADTTHVTIIENKYDKGETLNSGTQGQSTRVEESVIEAQVQQMNAAIQELRNDHQAQMEQMKQFYDQQIEQIRSQKEGQADDVKKSEPDLQNENPDQQQVQEAIEKLMDQNKFKETLNELNTAVGQKESLEKKLTRIKEKIKKAKQIRQENVIAVSRGLSPKSGGTLPSTIGTISTVNPCNVQTAIQEVNRQENYHTFKPQLMAPQLLPDQNQQLQMQYLQAQIQMMQEQSAQQNLQAAQYQLIQSQPQQQSHPILQHSHTTSYQPSICTQHDQQIQHNIVEKQEFYPSHMESKEEFESHLNFQYVPKDLKVKQKQQAMTQHQGEQKQCQPVPQQKFIEQTFNPHVRSQAFPSSHQKPAEALMVEQRMETANNDDIDGIYLRDTSQSMMNYELNSQRQQNIMQDQSRGINQKIVDLQRLKNHSEVPYPRPQIQVYEQVAIPQNKVDQIIEEVRQQYPNEPYSFAKQSNEQSNRLQRPNFVSDASTPQLQSNGTPGETKGTEYFPNQADSVHGRNQAFTQSYSQQTSSMHHQESAPDSQMRQQMMNQEAQQHAQQYHKYHHHPSMYQPNIAQLNHNSECSQGQFAMQPINNDTKQIEFSPETEQSQEQYQEAPPSVRMGKGQELQNYLCSNRVNTSNTERDSSQKPLLPLARSSSRNSNRVLRHIPQSSRVSQSRSHCGRSSRDDSRSMQPAEHFQMQEEATLVSHPSSVSLSRKFMHSYDGKEGSKRQEIVQKIIQVQCKEI